MVWTAAVAMASALWVPSTVDSGEKSRCGEGPEEVLRIAPSIDLLESLAEGGIPGLEGGDVRGWHLCLGRALKLHAAIHWYSEREVLRVEFALPELDSVDTIEERSGFAGLNGRRI